MAMNLMRMEILQPRYQNGKVAVFEINVRSAVLDSEMKQFVKDVKTLTNTGQTLAADDKVFFTPWSEVPRYKFNEYARDKPKLSRVIMFNKATAVVVEPSKIVPSLQGNCWEYVYYKIPKTAFQYHANLIQNKKYDELPETLYIRDGHISYATALVPISLSALERITVQEYGSYSDTDAIAEKIEVANMMLTGTKKLLSDTVMLEEINQGVTITTEIYEQLCNMLKGSDAQNIGLAMELMANADYKKSEFKIALLLNRFRGTVAAHKNAGLVNFRSLLNYFSKYSWQSGDVQFAESIVRNSDPALGDYQERLDLVAKTILDYVNGMLGAGIFSVDGIRINYSPKLSKAAVVVEEEVGELEED